MPESMSSIAKDALGRTTALQAENFPVNRDTNGDQPAQRVKHTVRQFLRRQRQAKVIHFL
jgi:hypothetical protein